MKTYKKNIKRVLLFCILAACTISFISCEKEQKKYDGEAQLAFANTSYKITATAQTSSITIPIQLIADKAIAATGTVTIDPKSTSANAVSFTPQFTIDPATFSYNLVIGIDYAALNSGKNTIILNLESSIKVAKYYGTTTITITK